MEDAGGEGKPDADLPSNPAENFLKKKLACP